MILLFELDLFSKFKVLYDSTTQSKDKDVARSLDRE